MIRIRKDDISTRAMPASRFHQPSISGALETLLRFGNTGDNQSRNSRFSPNNRVQSGFVLAMEVKAMNRGPLAAAGRRALMIAALVLVVALNGALGQSVIYAQGIHSGNGRPAQSLPNNLHSDHTLGRYSSYPVIDPTAAARAAVAGRIYRASVDERVQNAKNAAQPGQPAPAVDARSYLELAERLGRWSQRWQDAQDEAARSMEARYRAMWDHFARMSILENGSLLRGTGQRAGESVGPKPPREAADVARFFRPVDEWSFDRIVPALSQSKRPLNPKGVNMSSAEQVVIADRVYRVILDEAAGRFLASAERGDQRWHEATTLDVPLAERLAFWSKLWMHFQEILSRDASWRSRAGYDHAARMPSPAARSVGPGGHTAIVRSHVERMRELESGQFVNEFLKRAGRAVAERVDMTPFPEFIEAVHFFRIEAESQLTSETRSKNGADLAYASQAATAIRIYSSILDDAARRYWAAPRAGGTPPAIGRVFDSRLAERLAAWSINWAQARILADPSIDSRFNAVRSHAARMASLEDGRSVHESLERARPGNVPSIPPALPPNFADAAKFFRLDALWELAQMKSR
jgi:hypothetical protein